MLTIGKIAFANLYPIFHTLEREADPARYRFIEGVPSKVNRLLREGSVDVSPSSSIEYLRRPDRYVLIDGHSVSSSGRIRSILLFSNRPLEDLGGGTVLASSQSETSIALLKIVLARFRRITAVVEPSSEDLSAGLAHAMAYMLIGDDALTWLSRAGTVGDDARAVLPLSGGGRPVFIYDLGELWHRETSLPFVFALWIARADRGVREELPSFTRLLDRARDYAAGHLDGIARESPYKEMLGTEGLVSYWNVISYGLDERHRKGLALFRSLLAEEGLLDRQ